MKCKYWREFQRYVWNLNLRVCYSSEMHDRYFRVVLANSWQDLIEEKEKKMRER